MPRPKGRSMKAPAVGFPEPGRVEIWDMEVAEPGPDDVRVRTAFSGISQGTERWALTGRYGHFDEDYSEYYPCSPGYQAAGVVEAGVLRDHAPSHGQRPVLDRAGVCL